MFVVHIRIDVFNKTVGVMFNAFRSIVSCFGQINHIRAVFIDFAQLSLIPKLFMCVNTRHANVLLTSINCRIIGPIQSNFI